MSRRDDDLDDMSAVTEILREFSVHDADDAAPDPAVVTRFLDELTALGDGPAPEPSLELAAMLGGAVPLAVARRRRATRGVRHQVIAVAAAFVLALTALAAATDRLPGPAQRVVTRVVNDITPFHIDPVAPGTAIPSPAPGRSGPPRAPIVPAPTNDDSSKQGDKSSGTGDDSGAPVSGGESANGSAPRGEDTAAAPGAATGGGEAEGAAATTGSGWTPGGQATTEAAYLGDDGAATPGRPAANDATAGSHTAPAGDDGGGD